MIYAPHPTARCNAAKRFFGVTTRHHTLFTFLSCDMDASDGSPVTTVSATPNISVKVITTSTPLPPQATGLPEWFLLQTSDLVLRQVSRALIRGSTNEWWRAFAGVSSSIASPLVIREHDGLSVFGFD